MIKLKLNVANFFHQLSVQLSVILGSPLKGNFSRSVLNPVSFLFPSLIFSLYFMFGNIYIARADNQMPVGVRPLGMGSSFTAVSDDANAIAWNPAGLVNVRQQAISGMTTNLHGIESLQQNYLSYIIPITDRHAVGFDWMQLRFGDDELRYSDDRVSLSYGVGLTRSLSAGLNIKRVSVGSELDTYPIGNASGFGFDIGFRYQPTDWLAFGVFGQDITDTEISFDYDGTDIAGDQRNEKDDLASSNIRFGIMYKPLDQTLLALDLDKNIHIGLEQSIQNILAIRGGLEARLDKITPMGSESELREPISLSLGGTLQYKSIRFDYAYMNAPTLNDTHRFSMTLGFDYDPKRILVDSITLRDVLLTFYQQYQTPNPLSGQLVLTSIAKKDLEVSISTFIPKYMDKPLVVAKDILLPASGSETSNKKVPLAFQFNKKVEQLDEDLLTEAEIVINYKYLGRTREIRKRRPITLRQMGKVAYREKLDPMVAFIDPTDPVTKSFALSASQITVDNGNMIQISNLLNAMKIYEALSSRGIEYRSDDSLPFQSIYGRGYVVDETTSYTQSLLSAADLWYIDVDGPFKKMRYPRTMLGTKKLVADCDELTVLYSTLLESIDIRTKIVDLGEDTFLMFETNLNPSSDLNIKKRLVVHNEGKSWIPVDVRAFGSSFVSAWKAGAEAYENGKIQGELKLVDVRAAWNTYVRMHPQTNLDPVSLVDKTATDQISTSMSELAEIFNN